MTMPIQPGQFQPPPPPPPPIDDARSSPEDNMEVDGDGDDQMGDRSNIRNTKILCSRKQLKFVNRASLLFFVFCLFCNIFKIDFQRQKL